MKMLRLGYHRIPTDQPIEQVESSVALLDAALESRDNLYFRLILLGDDAEQSYPIMCTFN